MNIKALTSNRHKMLTKGAHNMINPINKINLMKIKSVTIVKGQTNIKICSINPRSVKNKTLSLCDYIISTDFDIVALMKTWLEPLLIKHVSVNCYHRAIK